MARKIILDCDDNLWKIIKAEKKKKKHKNLQVTTNDLLKRGLSG